MQRQYKLFTFLLLLLVIIYPAFSQKKVLLISLDAVGYEELVSHLDSNSNIMKVAQGGQLFKTKSIFPSNTYPVHVSIVTGKNPSEHKLFTNYEPNKEQRALWICDSRRIQSKTIWEAAKEKKLDTATILWPVAGKAKAIRYNMAEINTEDPKKLVIENLKANNPFMVIGALLKHSKDFGQTKTEQPGLDKFATSVTCDVIKKGKAELMLVHFTHYDTNTHLYGKYSEESFEALDFLDLNVGRMIAEVDDETLVIIMSDHSQLNTHTTINPNDSKLYDEGYYFLTGGSCFFVPENLTKDQVEAEKQRVLSIEGVDRLLTDKEMHDSAYDTIGSFGLSASIGYRFGTSPYKADHGYTLDRENYDTFVITSKKQSINCESVLDVSKIISSYLGFEL